MSRESELSITWQGFVESCAQAYVVGVTEHEFGLSLVGRQVRWSGKIEELQLGKRVTVHGLRIHMPEVSVPLQDGTPFIGDFLFLALPADADQRAGRQKKVGDRVTFTGRFPDQRLLPNVSFTRDRERGEVILSIGLDDGRLIA